METTAVGLETSTGETEMTTGKVEMNVGEVETPVGRMEISIGRMETGVGRMEIHVCQMEMRVCRPEIRVCELEIDVCGIEMDVCGIEMDVCGIEMDVCKVKTNVCRVEIDVCGVEMDVCRAEMQWSVSRAVVFVLPMLICGYIMQIKPLHEWNLSPREAIQLQKQLAFDVVAEDRFDEPIRTVAGIDLGYDAKNDTSRAVVVVLKFPELELIESSEAILPIQFPYVPGLLSFRETPVAIKALEKLENAPDLILCDGQGLAHPRRFGIACHIGLLADVPTIGVAKSLLIGKFENLGETRGSTAALIHKNEQIGVALRSKDKVQPLYVSIGHRIRLETAIKYVLACAPKYRLPETTRLADKMASYRKK